VGAALCCNSQQVHHQHQQLRQQETPPLVGVMTPVQANNVKKVAINLECLAEPVAANAMKAAAAQPAGSASQLSSPAAATSH